MSTPFDEVEAAAKLGFPGERFESVTPYMLTGVYWVMIGSEGKMLGRPVFVERGHVVTETGYAIGMAWLRQLAGSKKPELDPWPGHSEMPHGQLSAVPQVLRWYEALPGGWSENELFAVDPQTNERGHVSLQPIEVKLVSSVYVPTWSQSVEPGTPSRPPPTFGSSGAPSGGGLQQHQQPCRAMLSEVAGKLTWVIESFDPFAKEWSVVFREPAES